MARNIVLEASGNRVLFDGAEFTGTFRQPLGRNSEAVIYWRGPLTAKSVRRLCASLEMQAGFLDERSAPKERYEIIDNGPLSFVLVDNESGDPAPCYTTRAEAETAMRELIAETAHETMKQANT